MSGMGRGEGVGGSREGEEPLGLWMRALTETSLGWTPTLRHGMSGSGAPHACHVAAEQRERARAGIDAPA